MPDTPQAIQARIDQVLEEQTADLANRFTYHPPTPEQPPVYELVRDSGHHLALVVTHASKPSREQSLALTAIEEAVMHANAAVARHGLPDNATRRPADLHDQVLDLLAQAKPRSVLVSTDPDHWHIGSSAEVHDETPPYLVLELGLRLLRGQTGCEHTVGGGNWGMCFRSGRVAVARYGADQACTPCIADAVLAGRELPVTDQDAPAADATVTGPHSRACGITMHVHGPACASDCPTCHGG